MNISFTIEDKNGDPKSFEINYSIFHFFINVKGFSYDDGISAVYKIINYFEKKYPYYNLGDVEMEILETSRNGLGSGG
jgi:hypothetical protein